MQPNAEEAIKTSKSSNNLSAPARRIADDVYIRTRENLLGGIWNPGEVMSFKKNLK